MRMGVLLRMSLLQLVSISQAIRIFLVVRMRGENTDMGPDGLRDYSGYRKRH